MKKQTFNSKTHYRHPVTGVECEILDATPVSIPIDGEEISSVDAKLHAMLERMMVRYREPEFETEEDDLDFEVPSTEPVNRYTNFATKEDADVIKRSLKKKKSSEKNRTAGEDPAGSKSAPTDRAERVEVDKDESTSGQSNKIADDKS